MFAFMLFILFPVLMIAAALQDLFSMKISDWTSALLCIAFLGLFFTPSFDHALLLSHIGLAGLAFAGFGAAFLFGWIGGGDAKLAAATILWVGQGEALVDYLVMTALVGGGFAITWVILHQLLRLSKKSGAGIHTRASIPYGVALGLSGLYVWPQLPLIAMP